MDLWELPRACPARQQPSAVGRRPRAAARPPRRRTGRARHRHGHTWRRLRSPACRRAPSGQWPTGLRQGGSRRRPADRRQPSRGRRPGRAAAQHPGPGAGGAGHHFRFAKPLSEQEISEAEEQRGVSLPAEYRSFLLEVGAGGAGPDYGLSVLRRTDAGWPCSNVDRGLRHDYLGLPFLTGEGRWRVLAEHDDGQPLQSGCADEAYFAACGAWMTAGDELFDRVACGALKLGHEGCASCYWLVLTGPERGRMWWDDRPGDGEFSLLGEPRTPVGCTRWFLGWVEGAEVEARRPLRRLRQEAVPGRAG
ncbi:SMI1/KNR4 family protein [Streptomyces sp. NPDC005811]|uniref:SMI1/KNR4 family protein n=1 Tax=Streptomyces sp. NPDC005811 TaxID=3154565 RepID=UPI0033DB9496